MIAFELEDFVDNFKGKTYGKCSVFLIVFICIVELSGLYIYLSFSDGRDMRIQFEKAGGCFY